MEGSNRKLSKLERKAKKSRLIIRNLPFKTKKEDIEKTFSPFGNIVDINLPKKENTNQFKGFAFVSFDNVGSSLRAIKHINGKKILNRPVAVDFAVAKRVYTNLSSQESKEPEKETKVEVENGDQNDEQQSQTSEHSNHEEDDDDDDDLLPEQTNKLFSKRKSDVDEGKTLFIRNVDFETDEATLSKFFQNFGSIEYCKICQDNQTGLPKGTAFVKFGKKEDAQKCLSSSEQSPENFLINGQKLEIVLALARQSISDMMESKRLKLKDKRNLYLAKEGLIYPNSPAAGTGVSQSDLKKRLTLEEKKRRLLQNYHYFISDCRLCVHNLPANYTDQQLRKLFLEAANDRNAKILWAKVMRNRSRVDQKFGKSKGFGFVEFEQHVHALKALRHLNNNPNTFTSEKRPIVEFSVENRVALNRKKYRLMKENKTDKNLDKKEKPKRQRKTKKTESLSLVQNEDQDVSEFAGVTSKPFIKGEKLQQSKLSRKISEHQKELIQRGKKLKFKRSKELKKKLLARSGVAQPMTRKVKNKDRKNDEDDVDRFEKRHLKRKPFLIQENDQKTLKVLKKQKWYQK